MNTVAKTLVPLSELRTQLEARTQEFANALPSHIKPEHFQRATLTAIAQTPKLLDVDRRSLFNALMRCAQDGLIPDGRQAALVIFKDRERGPIAQYMPMIQGIRKLVQQSGEITRFEQTVVHENDKFEYELGDHPHIFHKPAVTDLRGPPLLVYSIAQYRDGTLSREVMTVEEIEKVRGISRAKDLGPWVDWWEEMARKTIAKRHAKVLPMSNDAAAALARDDAEHFELPAVANVGLGAPPQNRPRLADKLDQLGTASGPSPEPDVEPTRPKRGRPKKTDDDLSDEQIETSQARLGAVIHSDQYDARLKADLDRDPIERPLTGEEPELQVDDGWPGPVRHDYEQGKRDAIAGHTDCLNRDIRDIAARYAEWRNGFDSVKKRNR